MHAILKRFESPYEVREFPPRRFELIRMGDMTKGADDYVSE